MNLSSFFRVFFSQRGVFCREDSGSGDVPPACWAAMKLELKSSRYYVVDPERERIGPTRWLCSKKKSNNPVSEVHENGSINTKQSSNLTKNHGWQSMEDIPSFHK